MNIDTDTQYAFTRPLVDHVMKNYDGVLKVDGEVGVKKAYDPRTWGKAAEVGMSQGRHRVQGSPLRGDDPGQGLGRALVYFGTRPLNFGMTSLASSSIECCQALGLSE